MKNKVVIWGTNAQNEKVLMALELKEAENKVAVYVIPEPIASEEFISKLNDTWKDNKGTVEFPEGHTLITTDLSVSDGILPEGLKADRPDMVSRAQTEWHFIVLSGKLHKVYQQELEELKEKVGALTDFDNGLWQSLRGFWDKVQEQSRERNLFRSHADSLRDTVNQLFEEMKGVRKRVESEFSGASVKIFQEINEKLTEIEARIEKGGNKMHIVFEDLKNLQNKYRSAKMTNEHRSKAYDRIDAAFKAAKEKRFGADANEGSLVERHNRRLQGLLEAIARMRDSARRDESELEFQRKKVQTTEGQLEAQIRQAKIKMIEERLTSKQERIADMEKTKADIERQIANVSDREEKRKRMEAAKVQAKNEIAAITTKGGKKEAGVEADDRSLNVPATQSVMDALSNVLGETLEDVVDTVKAVASVMTDKAEEALGKAAAVASEVVDIVTKEHTEEELAAAAEKRAAAPVEESPAEAPVEEAPVAETPAEAPVEEAPVAETPAEEAAAEAPATEEKADEDKPTA